MADKRKSIGNTLLGLFVVRPEDEAEADAGSDGGGKSGSDAAVDDLIARYAGGSSGGSSSGSGASAGAAGAATAARTATGRTRPPVPPIPAAAGRAPSTAPRAPAGARPPAPPSAPGAQAGAELEPAAAGAEIPQVKVDFAAVLKRGGLSDEEQGRVDKALTLLHNLPAETPIEIKRQIVAASLQAFGIPVDHIIESAALHLSAFDRHIKEGQVQTQSLLEQSTRRLSELEQEVGRVKQVMQEQLAQQQGLTASCNQQKLRVQEVLDFFGREAVERVAQTSIKLRDKLQDL